MKKILSLFLILTLISSALCTFSVNAADLPEGQLSGDYWYNLLEDGTAEITDYAGDDDVINIPSEIEGYTVTSIGIDAFLSVTAAEVYLPDTVTTIKTTAFRIMQKLEKIHIPDSVTAIGQGAFQYCESLNSITFPENLEKLGRMVLDHTPYYDNPDNWKNNVLYSGNYAIAAKENISGVCEIKEGTTLVADYAFCGLSEVEEFNLPQSLKYIGDASFSSCNSVKSVTIPENVISVADNAFFNCSALESLTLPENIKHIGAHFIKDTAYYNNPDNWQNGALYVGNALISAHIDSGGKFKINDGTRIVAAEAFCAINITSIIMPDSVEYISESAFSSCYKLETIRLSENIKEISNWAFSDCISLTDVKIPDSVVVIGDRAFWGCRSLMKVIVPETVEEIGYCALGYQNIAEPTRYPDFMLYGTRGCVAEKYAKENGFPFEYVNKYKDDVLRILDIPTEDPGTGEGWLQEYRELYKYYSEPPETYTATPDFVLVEVYENIVGASCIAEVFGDYILRNNNYLFPYAFGYFIYIPETKELYPLENAYKEGIDGVYSLFTENIIGSLIGDVNYDNELNIKDATLIQKHLAQFETITNNIIEGFISSEKEDVPYYIGDYNRDGKMNIRDATAIQKKLAGLEYES